MSKRSISDVDLGGMRGRTAVVRADLNVPLDDGFITDDQRIRASLLTLRRLTGAGARVVLLSHLGRPEGRVDSAFSLAPVASRLSELIDSRVHFIAHTNGDFADSERQRRRPGRTVREERSDSVHVGVCAGSRGQCRDAGSRWM